VPISVTDKAGKALLKLGKHNFAVFEDGKQQTIEEFSAATAPFEVALLLDTSGSTRADLDLIRRAAGDFIASLRPGDRVSIVSFRTVVKNNRSVSVPEVVTRLTDDRAELRAALGRVSTGNGTPYYDALLEITESVFHDEPNDAFRGRRALVALTDGVDSASDNPFTEARAKVTGLGISSYFINIDTRESFENDLLGDCANTIRFSQAQINRYYAGFGRNSKLEKTSDFCRLGDFERLAISKALYELAETEMSELSRVSGGRVFPASDLTEARAAFKSVAEEIGTKYSLGYYSTNEKRDGKFRSIKVELKGLPAGSNVRAREGYTAPSN
jgi:Ca-activated chloride channel homolog